MYDKIILSISGMACCSCVSKIKKTLKEQDGVGKVEIDFDSKMARVHTTLPAPELIAAVKVAGYEAEKLN